MKLKDLLTPQDSFFSRFLNREDIVWMDTDDVLKMAAPIPTHMSDKEWNDLWVSLQKKWNERPTRINNRWKNYEIGFWQPQNPFIPST